MEGILKLKCVLIEFVQPNLSQLYFFVLKKMIAKFCVKAFWYSKIFYILYVVKFALSGK